MEPVRSGRPPSLEALSSASLRCATNGLATTLHLALPAQDVASCSVRLSRRSLVWRGFRVSRSGDDAADVLLLVLLGRRDEDRFLALSDADAASWVKPVRSGRRIVAYGATSLLGIPPVVADPSLSAGDVRRACSLIKKKLDHAGRHQYGSDGSHTLDALLEGGVRVRGGHRLLALQPDKA